MANISWTAAKPEKSRAYRMPGTHVSSSFLSLGQLVAGISLSVPTADVLRSTSVDCQWTADATDPASFGLFMQFSDATGPFTQRVPVITVQRGTALKGTVPTIMNVAVLGMHRFAAYASIFDSNSQPLAISPAFNVIAPTIKLSVPTTDVAVGASVDCQWTSSATDPARFQLVMQFTNSGSHEFEELAAVTVVQRGTSTSGTVPNIKNVEVAGMHRLAAYPEPFDAGNPQPWSVSPAFNVVANSTQSSGSSTSTLPTNSSTSPASPSKSNHTAVIVAVVVIVVVLALAVLGALLFLRRRRRRQNANTVPPPPVLAEELGPRNISTATYNNTPPPMSGFPGVSTGSASPRQEKMARNGHPIPQRLEPSSSPPLSDVGSGSALVESEGTSAVAQRLQRQEAELEALRTEVRTLMQPPPSYS